MSGLWRFLFHAGGTVPPDRWYVTFASPWDVKLVLPLALLAFLFLLLSYRAQPSRMPPRLKTAAAALKFCAVAVLVCMVWRPVIRIEKVVAEKPYLVFIADKSLSMQVKDVERGREVTSRDAAVSALCARIAASDPAKRFSLAAFTVGERIRRADLEKMGSIPADHRFSRIYSQAMRVIRRFLGKPVAGVYLFTDGNNTGESVDEEDFNAFILQECKGAVPCTVITAGREKESFNITAEELTAPRNVLARERIEVILRYAVSGEVHGSLTAVLEENGVEVARKETLPRGGKGIVMFSFRPRVEGDVVVSVTIPPLRGETITADNGLSRVIRVYRGTLKILFIEGSPRWEYRYLKNALLRDKMISVSLLLLSADRGFVQEGDVPLTRFPSAADLETYDAVVIGDVPASFFSDAEMRNLARCVEKRGTGLVWIPGRNETAASYIGTPLEDLLPVVLVKEEDYTVFREAERVRAFRPRIAPEAWDHPVMRLADDPETNRRVWEQLPPLYRFVRTGGVKPGRKVLAEYPGLPGEESAVLFAAGYYGTGKCFFSAVENTWRWRFGVGDLYFYRFWVNVFRYVSSGRFAEGRKPCLLLADRQCYEVGEPVTVTALVRDKDFNPVKSPSWKAVVEDPGGTRRALELKPVEGSPGHFKGSFYPSSPGTYGVFMPDTEGREEKMLSVKVEMPRGEVSHVRVNRKGLARALRGTGGKIYRVEKPGALLEDMARIPARSREEVLVTDVDIFNHWFFFTLVVCALTAEWILRKIYRFS